MGVLQARRPPLRGLIEAVGAYAGLWVAHVFGGNSAPVYAVVFVAWFAAMVVASLAAERSSAFTLEGWDSVIGGTCGIVTGIIFAHALLRMVLIVAGPETAIAESLNTIWLSREVLHATSIKNLLHLGQEFATEVGRT